MSVQRTSPDIVSDAPVSARPRSETFDATFDQVKRIRNDSHVTIAPSTFRGRATGVSTEAVARPLSGDDAARAKRLNF